MPKKFFVSIILLMFLALSGFSYYFYSSHSLKSQNPNKTFNPKRFSEKVLDQTIILAPKSLMYSFLKHICSTTRSGNRNVNIDLAFNNTKYSKINFKYHTKILGDSSKQIDSYYVSESLEDFKDSILYKQNFSFDSEDEYSSIELVKKDNSFIIDGKRHLTIKEACEFFDQEYEEILSKITKLDTNKKAETITIEDQSFRTSYVKYGVDINALNESDKIKFYNENWTATEKELNGFSIKSIKHTNDHDTVTQLIHYKFDKKN